MMTYAPRPPEPPLDQPYYGASFATAFLRFWKKGLTFTGRASRSEYWFAYLATMVVFLGLYLIGVWIATASEYTYSPAGGGVGGFFIIVAVLYGLATLVPQLAITWRRLHDTNKSGAMYFLGFIPFVGGIILLILVAMESDPAGAQYDVAPYAVRPGGYGAHPAGSAAPSVGYQGQGAPPASPYSTAPNPFLAGAAPVPAPPVPGAGAPVPPPPAYGAPVPAGTGVPVPLPPAPNPAPASSALRAVPPPPPPSATSAATSPPPPPPAVAPAAAASVSVASVGLVSAPSAAPAALDGGGVITGMPGAAPITTDEDADDLDQTRMSVPRADGWSAELPDGRRIPVSAPLYFGRAPVAEHEHPQALLVPTDDPAKSMSKTHARIIPAGDGIDITDLHSTNGTIVTQEGGSPTSLTPGVPQHVEGDATVSFGDYVVRLRSGR